MSSQTILILFGVAFLCFFILYLLSKGDKKKLSNFYSVYTPNGLQLVKKLEEIAENNQSIPWVGEIKLYQKMFGDLPAATLDNFEKAVGIYGNVDAPEGTPLSIAGDYVTMLAADLAQRHVSQYSPLKAIGESEAMQKFGLNIHANEVIHDNLKRVDWLEEKTITTSYSYGGFQYRLSGGSGLSYRMGNLSVIPNTTQKFTTVDRGTLYITNKRIIFVGTEKRVNKSIDLDDILEFSIFRDGILIGKSNGKKPLIQFPEWIIQPNKAPNKRDHLNRIVRVLDRVLQKNQNETIAADEI